MEYQGKNPFDDSDSEAFPEPSQQAPSFNQPPTPNPRPVHNEHPGPSVPVRPAPTLVSQPAPVPINSQPVIRQVTLEDDHHLQSTQTTSVATTSVATTSVAKNPHQNSNSPSFVPPPEGEHKLEKEKRKSWFKRDEKPFDFELNDQNLRNKKHSLKQREALLEERENRVAQRELNLEGTHPQRTPNWPACFNCWKFRPLLYHDIATDFGEFDDSPDLSETQKTQKQAIIRTMYLAYYQWVLQALLWVFNVIAIFLVLFTDVEERSSSRSAALALVLMVAGIVVSFAIYRKLYNASRKHRASGVLLWALFYIAWLILIIWMIVGWPGWGGAGFGALVAAWGDWTAVTFVIIALLCWISQCLWMGFVLIRGCIFWRALSNVGDKTELNDHPE